jgi:NADH-quinone oxidoreductase subunit H
VAQLVSYEVPHVLSIAAPVMLAGSMSLVTIVNKQPVWYAVVLPASAIIVMLSGMAEVGRSPFDLLDAESEIIAGHHIEYSGMKFALFFLAEYVHAFAVSCIVTALFLGGWRSPSPLVSMIGVVLVLVVLLINMAARSSKPGFQPGTAGVFGLTAIAGLVLVLFSALPLIGVTVPWLWFFVKTILVFDVMVWSRGTLPRLRIDQLMAFNWKFLVPLSLANLVVVAVANRLAQAAGLTMGTWPWALTMLAFNLALIVVALALVGSAGRRVRRTESSELASEEHVELAHEEALSHDVDQTPAVAGVH